MCSVMQITATLRLFTIFFIDLIWFQSVAVYLNARSICVATERSNLIMNFINTKYASGIYYPGLFLFYRFPHAVVLLTYRLSDMVVFGFILYDQCLTTFNAIYFRRAC